MTMLVAPAHNRPIPHAREVRRSRAVYGTLRTMRSNSTAGAGPLLTELAMLAVFLLVVVGVIALRAWLYVPQI